jgi:hypothetical protein
MGNTQIAPLGSCPWSQISRQANRQVRLSQYANHVIADIDHAGPGDHREVLVQRLGARTDITRTRVMRAPTRGLAKAPRGTNRGWGNHPRHCHRAGRPPSLRRV